MGVGKLLYNRDDDDEGMSLKVSVVGLQVKQVKNALQYLAKIGEGHAHLCVAE